MYFDKFGQEINTRDNKLCEKVLYTSTEASYEEMLRIIKYDSETKNYGLKIFPKRPNDVEWCISVYIYSDYVKYPTLCHNVIG